MSEFHSENRTVSWGQLFQMMNLPLLLGLVALSLVLRNDLPGAAVNLWVPIPFGIWLGTMVVVTPRVRPSVVRGGIRGSAVVVFAGELGLLLLFLWMTQGTLQTTDFVTEYAAPVLTFGFFAASAWVLRVKQFYLAGAVASVWVWSHDLGMTIIAAIAALCLLAVGLYNWFGQFRARRDHDRAPGM